MAELEFENRILHLFAQTPALADADRFARRVETRLDRGWTLRRALIGVAGLGGGIIAVGQMLGAGMVDRVTGLSESSVASVSQGARALGGLRFLVDLPVGAEVAWTAAGLAALAVVLMAARAIEEF
jgi:hypothetical protein